VTTSSSKARGVPPPTGAAPKAASSSSPYARFIPREELHGFSAWAPGNLSAGAAAPAEAPPPEPEAPPAETIEQQLRAARQSGYQDGYRDGLVALEGFKQSFAQQTTRQIGVLVQAVGSQLDGLQDEMAHAVLSTALRLAAQVVRGELRQQPEIVATIAAEAVEALLLNARHVTVRVNPDDFTLVTQGAADVLEARGARLVADAAVARGGCRVDSDIGSVDAGIDARWRRATKALGVEDVPLAADAATEAGGLDA